MGNKVTHSFGNAWGESCFFTTLTIDNVMAWSQATPFNQWLSGRLVYDAKG